MKKFLALLVVTQILLVACNTSKTPSDNTNKQNSEEEIVACTQEAKLCPDGSFVGRRGPSCQFDACPEYTGGETDQEGMKLFEDSILSFKYPVNIDSEFITPQVWPPTYTLIPEAFNGCQDEIHNVAGTDYCVNLESEGAAGTTINSYRYISMASENQNSYLQISFDLRFPQCANYDEPQKLNCETEQKAFDVDAIAHTILQSVVLK